MYSKWRPPELKNLKSNTGLACFKEGRTSIEDEPRSGRPNEAATPSKLEAVDKLVRAKRRIKVEEIAESLSISIGTVHSILHEDLGYSKVCCRLVTCDETWVAHYEPESKQQSLRWKHPSSCVTKRFRAQRSVKKVMLTVFWDVRGPITISFLEQGTTVNSENYCQLLQQVKDIKNNRRGMQSRGVILHQDNARPHTATRTIETINQLGWELFEPPTLQP
ncbi:histone-lysine N-methyltransferase SETMAR-like [Watersipora subatra]|uniref:histone-lysine N-methyltransferase SETMAR-like n=1 Tax=Watersipora subatra TaxID=2589382 RepID=UPI00355C3A09